MAKKPEQEPVAPIIIKKIDGGHHGHHGGAWKIALADMMTAMMAFFLLMWLLGATNESQRKSIADYFKPTPKSVIDLSKGAGSNGVLGGRSMLDDQGLPNAAMQTSLFETVVPPRMGSEDQGTADPAGDTAQDTPPPEDSATDAAAREAAEARRFEQLEEEIKAKGIAYKVGKVPFIANGRARAFGETDGFVKIIADAKTDRIIGAHIIGPNASELIAELVIGVEFSASAEDIGRSSHAHPTLAEVMKEAALAVDKRSLNF